MKFTTLGYGADAVEYNHALSMQREAHARVVAGGPNEVLLLEHQAVYTAGKRTQPDERPQDGTPVIDVDRGGKITWHGPGQLVGYPIIQLGNARDVIAYVRRVEDVLMAACAAFGIKTVRIKGRSGVWVPADDRGEARKIAALGIRVSRNVTMHGFAINCDNSLDPYHMIVPCGIADAGVTTLSAEVGRTITVLDVVPHIESAILAGFLTEDRAPGWEPPLAFLPPAADLHSRSHPIVGASKMPSVADPPTHAVTSPAPPPVPTSAPNVDAVFASPNHPAKAKSADDPTSRPDGQSDQNPQQPAAGDIPETAIPPKPASVRTSASTTAHKPAAATGYSPDPEPKTELLNLSELERSLEQGNAHKAQQEQPPAISPVATTPPRIPSYQESRPSPGARPAPSHHPTSQDDPWDARSNQQHEPLIDGLVRKATATWQRLFGTAKRNDRR